MQFTIALVAAFAALAAAGPSTQSPREAFAFSKRATLPVPASKGSVTYKAPQEVSGTFDGGMKTYGRGVSCTGQVEGADKDAVFIVKNGGTLKNVIIGKDQIEGIHCEGSCTIENVWWVKVCEDALTLKGDGNAMIKGGGAQAAADKVIQHNGEGTVTIDGFQAYDFGKLYRACGNCKKSASRSVIIKNVKAVSGKMLAGINPNFGGTATIQGTCCSSVKTVCEEFKGTKPGSEPASVHAGPSTNCKYSPSEIKAC